MANEQTRQDQRFAPPRLWQQLELPKERAERLKEEWLATFPELAEYFVRRCGDAT